MLTFMFKLNLKVQNYDEVLEIEEIWRYLNQVFLPVKNAYKFESQNLCLRQLRISTVICV